MNTKSAINKAKKSKVVRKKSATPKRRWTGKDLRKMVRIIKGAPNSALGQRLAADHFNVSYAAIQCRWSRYNRGIGMSRIDKKVEKTNERVEKVKEKVKTLTFTQCKVYDLPPRVRPQEKSLQEEKLSTVLSLITVKKVDVQSEQRQVIIHY